MQIAVIRRLIMYRAFITWNEFCNTFIEKVSELRMANRLFHITAHKITHTFYNNDAQLYKTWTDNSTHYGNMSIQL